MRISHHGFRFYVQRREISKSEFCESRNFQNELPYAINLILAAGTYRNAIARPARATPNQQISDNEAASLPNPEPCLALVAVAFR